MPPRAVLIGLPGVGKSTVGARLARQLAVPFADSDQLVIERAGRSVTEIFTEDGEPAFRELEAAAILAALADFDGVLALGGGAVTTAAVRDALADSTVPVVLLTAGEAELLRRIGLSRHRPLLAEDPPRQLAELVRTRAAIFRQLAGITVETAGRPVDAVVRVLHQQLTKERA
ncbi:MAG: shikimate kinase [Actinomycetota bacterium]|nr:shikimate kinase [Actinomycetota bacterium]MDQ2959120.1 shikimate kinase [Actinomycetota bacterium]